MRCMKCGFAGLAMLGFAATAATAQTIPASIADYLQQIREDDGGFADTSFKINNPSAAGEGFNVDFNTDVGAGTTIYGMAIQTFVSAGPAPQFGYVALCGDNLAVDSTGRTPDIGSPLSILNNPTGAVNTGFCTGFTTYDLPDVVTGSTGLHAAFNFPTNDTGTWICTDVFTNSGAAHTGRRHSFFTTNAYATAATAPLTNMNWIARVATAPPTSNGGVFLINGSAAASSRVGENIALQFWSADSAAPTLYLQCLDVGTLIPLPGIVLTTGFANFAPISIQALGQLTAMAPCVAVGQTVAFRAFFLDNLDLNPNGKKKIKLTSASTVNFVTSGACAPNLCFGIKDDGVMDSGIIKISNPAGSKDVVSTHLGHVQNNGGLYGNPTISNLTAVEETTWDFCGGACWQEVGIYPSNTVVDPTGNSPDMASPIASVSGSSACPGLGMNGGTWGFPASVYDTPDVAVNSSTDYHTAETFVNADSCLWLGVDSDGFDDNAGNNCFDEKATAVGTFTFFSQNAYATPGSNWLGYNLMQRIDWN